VLSVEPGGFFSRNEELGPVGVRSSISHRQYARAGVCTLEVLIGELIAVDRLSTGTIATSEIATLDHEFGNDPVEDGALVSKALLASAESTEVLDRPWDIVVEEVEHDAFRFGAVWL